MLRSLKVNFSKRKVRGKDREYAGYTIGNARYVDAIPLMERYRVDLEDALHLATALRLGARRIVSNDADFDRTPLKRVF
jgi:predicted nucleic acid-binding protein